MKTICECCRSRLSIPNEGTSGDDIEFRCPSCSCATTLTAPAVRWYVRVAGEVLGPLGADTVAYLCWHDGGAGSDISEIRRGDTGAWMPVQKSELTRILMNAKQGGRTSDLVRLAERSAPACQRA